MEPGALNGANQARLPAWLSHKIESICVGVVVGMIRGYQLLISPWLGGNCRFVPTCSQYAVLAVRSHGVRRGLRLTIRRLLSCRPGGRSGYDPVPEAESLPIGESRQ